jgi:hypothetical protein
LGITADEKFLEYHRENEERKGKPYLSAEAQRQFVQDAGFVDIQVIQKWCDHGTYTDGMFIEIRKSYYSRSGGQKGRCDWQIRSWIPLASNRNETHSN